MIGLAVRLLIPDTTALTARRALRQQGLATLAEVRREVCWGLALEDETPASVTATAQRLLSADVLVNQNKERARWWEGPLEAAALTAPPAASGRWAAVLVEERDDAQLGRMQRLLSTRLGFAGLEVARHGTLWWLGSVADDPEAMARRAAELLFVNRHGQTASYLTSSPSLVGGTASEPG